MKTKRICFNIDLAQKIQAGKAAGRIATMDGKPVRIVCWDRNNAQFPIIALIGYDETPILYTIGGKYYYGNELANNRDLTIELPAPDFKPYDRVLVRDNGNEWHCTFYSHFDNNIGEHLCADGHYHEQCIPYEGNEHLVGTTDEPKEE